MALCADILAIGPFSEEIAPHLEYPEQRYRETRPGTPVVVVLFGIVEGSGPSRQFAEALGVSDPWDFNQHKLSLSRVNVEKLRVLLQGYSERDLYLRDVEALSLMIERGFDFYFRPNG